jgi:hypothetical protein
MPARMVIQSNDLSWRNLKKHKKLFRFQRYLLAAERSKKSSEEIYLHTKTTAHANCFVSDIWDWPLVYLSRCKCLLSVNINKCSEI